MSKKQLEEKYNCIIDRDISMDSGFKYYMVFDYNMNPLFSAYTLKEIKVKLNEQ